jgi:hypothetical protein
MFPFCLMLLEAASSVSAEMTPGRNSGGFGDVDYDEDVDDLRKDASLGEIKTLSGFANKLKEIIFLACQQR